MPTAPDLSAFPGEWRGTWRTWVEPGVLHDESAISGVIRGLLGGRDLLYSYRAEIAGDAVEGTALIGPSQDGCTVAWVDTWHTSALVLTSHGGWVPGGLEVSTNFRAEGELWKWTTGITIEAGRLMVRHWNEGPSIAKYLGVEAVLDRT